jgi:hypothetical protein
MVVDREDALPTWPKQMARPNSIVDLSSGNKLQKNNPRPLHFLSTLGPLFATRMHGDRHGIACKSGQARMDGCDLQVRDNPDHCNLIPEARCRFAARCSSRRGFCP